MRRYKPKDIKITYELVASNEEEIRQRMEKVFDIIFRKTLESYQFNENKDGK